MEIFDLSGGRHYNSGGAMRIEILGSPGMGVQGESGEHLAAGQIYTVSESFGHLLVASGRARRAPEGGPVAAPDEIQTADPTAAHSDPKPARRKRPAR